MKLLFENWRKYLNEEGEEDTSTIVQQAFENTPEDDRTTTLNQRTPKHKSAAGSVFLETPTWDFIRDQDWVPYPHPAITSPAIGFKAPIPGILGIADIKDSTVPDEIMFQPAHGGKAMTKKPNPETGEHEVLAEVVANIPENVREVQHTTLLIGPSREDPKKLQVWTFFPGDPTPQLPEITMRQIQEKYNTNETQIRGSKQDAIDIGYGFVKHADI